MVIRTKNNTPLLFHLADQFGFIPMVTIDSPRGIKKETLQEHLKGLFFVSSTENFRISNEELIRTAAEQDGGAHVDLEVNADYHFANEGMLIGGFPPKVLKLKILGEHVLKAGEEFLHSMSDKEK